MSDKQYTNDIVISTRIRLARNLRNHCFPNRACDVEAEQINKQILSSIIDSPFWNKEKMIYIPIHGMQDVHRTALVEGHIISKEIGKYPHSGIILNADRDLSIMINEDDHIRIQSIVPGFSLKEAYGRADTVDRCFEDKLKYAFDDKYGFLTSSPTNIGTGMRASVMLHIPALVLTAQLGLIVNMANQFRLTIRGIYGEGSLALGDLFQLSNQTALGCTEDEFIQNLHTVCKELIKLERSKRNEILLHDRDGITDRIYRAYGTLTNATLISTQESLKLLSVLRMGVDLHIITGIKPETVTSLMQNIQPATLSCMFNKNATQRERDLFRAQYIKENLLG